MNKLFKGLGICGGDNKEKKQQQNTVAFPINQPAIIVSDVEQRFCWTCKSYYVCKISELRSNKSMCKSCTTRRLENEAARVRKMREQNIINMIIKTRIPENPQDDVEDESSSSDKEIVVQRSPESGKVKEKVRVYIKQGDAMWCAKCKSADWRVIFETTRVPPDMIDGYEHRFCYCKECFQACFANRQDIRIANCSSHEWDENNKCCINCKKPKSV
jgi:hypothetical protein